MKILYCHCSLYNPGGMERVLLNKVKWLSSRGHEVVVVTTDQAGRAPFYAFPPNVRMIDLGINYSADNTLPLGGKIAGYLRKRRLHRARLTELLMRERPDFTVSLYPSESSFIPHIKDGSRKVLELHYNKNFRIQYGRTGLIGFIDRMRQKQDERLVAKFDDFVVLTRQDAAQWGNLSNLTVIPNAALPLGCRCNSSARRVIAVGRLDYQKGFDRLIDIWHLLMTLYPSLSSWRLDIYGQGEWHDMLQTKISGYGLTNVALNSPVKDIAAQYAASSIIAMTSHYEGFPMVLVEAMSCGLVPVTFDFPCGPRDIITSGVNGIIVKNGHTEAFARSLASLMQNQDRRTAMGQAALRSMDRYTEQNVMALWMGLFNR